VVVWRDGGGVAGWLCDRPDAPAAWELDPQTMARLAPGTWKPEQEPCALFDLRRDFSQSTDLSARHPEKMRELEALFWSDAEKYQVLPLLGGLENVWNPQPRKPERFTFQPGAENFSQGMIPPIYNRSFSISAKIEVPRSWCLFSLCFGGDGVIVANGSFLGGFALYVEGRRPRYTYSFLGVKIAHLVSDRKLERGEAVVRYEFEADAPGTLATGGTHRLFIDGAPGAESPRARPGLGSARHRSPVPDSVPGHPRGPHPAAQRMLRQRHRRIRV
jgi:arylsulfatase